tara:strand:+ start:44 stop:283 length:240 start_codon:yes stop_codon:yes gene_type:complete
MSNANMPAMPVTDAKGPYKQESGLVSIGLTKREHFAGLAMQGILTTVGTMWSEDADECALYAVKYADALLKALEKDNVN